MKEIEEKQIAVEEEKKAKKKKFKISISITTVLLVVCIAMVIGISGYSIHSGFAKNPSFCATCHNMESHVTSYLSSDHLDNLHAQANVMCKDCHSDYSLMDEVKSLVAFATGDYKENFKIKVGDDMCMQCHVSNEYLKVQTSHLVRNPHDSHWPDLKCTTCHKSHDKQVNYCAQCHDNGNQRMVEALFIEEQ